MQNWKTTITTANKYFARNQLSRAQALYELARDEAHSLFSIWAEPNEAVSALVVSYHNMAEVCQRQGDVHAARKLLEDIHKIILHAVSSTPIEHDRHCALYRGSIETYRALAAHKRCHLLTNLQ